MRATVSWSLGRSRRGEGASSWGDDRSPGAGEVGGVAGRVWVSEHEGAERVVDVDLDVRVIAPLYCVVEHAVGRERRARIVGRGVREDHLHGLAQIAAG